jgi:hypothetical protein
MSAIALTLGRPTNRRPIATIVLWIAIGLATLVAAVAAANLSLSGRTLTLIGLGLVLLPLGLRTSPTAAVVILLVAAIVIEQISYTFSLGIGTDEIFYFTSLSDGVGLSGVLITPLELTLAMILAIWLIQGIASHRLRFRKSQLMAAFAVLLIIILIAAVRGLIQGANLRTVLSELRPWAYLGACYLIASQLLRGRKAVQAVLWTFILGVGIKGLQGTYKFVTTLNVYPRPDFIFSHEEAVFLTLFLLLTAGLWIFGEGGWLRRVATALLPAVLVADLANSRRTAWVIFPASFIVMLVVAWIRLPERRRLIKRLIVVLACGTVVYLPLAWQSSAVWAQPARAVRSIVAPDERDRQSNDYRRYENANLMADIKRSTPWGQGLGIPIDYSTFPGHDQTDANSVLRFLPHDGILYIWMVLGIPGALAFWWLIGSSVVVACRVARAEDRRMALFGAFVLCAVVAYLIEGYYDFGLWWFRVAVLMGCLLGALEAAIREPSLRPTDARAGAGVPVTAIA